MCRHCGDFECDNPGVCKWIERGKAALIVLYAIFAFAPGVILLVRDLSR